MIKKTFFKKFVLSLAGAALVLQPLLAQAAPQNAYRVYLGDVEVDTFNKLPGENLNAEAAFSVTPDHLSFGNVPVGQVSAAQQVLIRNEAGTVVSFSGMHFNTPQYSVQSHDCPTEISPFQTCVANVVYAPKSQSLHLGELAVIAKGFKRSTVTLSGAGGPPLDSWETPDANPKPGVLQINPSPLSFGPVYLGVKESRFLVVTNTGELPVGLTSVQLTPYSTDFQLGTNGTCPQTLSAGDSCVLEIVARAQRAGERQGALVISSQGYERAEIDLFLEASVLPLSVAPAAVDFGQVLKGETATRIITLTNTQEGFVRLDGSLLAPHTRITNSECSGSIPPGQSCRIWLELQASAPGGDLSGQALSLYVQNGARIDIPVTGRVLDEVIDVSSQEIDFGDVQAGASPIKTLQVLNTGNLPISLAAPTLAGPQAGSFQAQSNCPVALQPAQTCVVQVQVQDNQFGQKTAQLTLQGDTASKTVDVLARVVAPQLEASVSELNFGILDPMQSNTRTVTLHNPSGAVVQNLSVAVSGAGFSATSNNCPAQLPAGVSCQIEVQMVHGTPGNYAGALTWDYLGASGNNQAVALSAGVSGASLTLSASLLEFNDAGVGSSPANRSTVITNTGLVDLVIQSLAPAGQDAADFSVTHDCPAAMPPGQTCTATVKFTPKSFGQRQAALVVESNAAGPAHQAQLSGVGLAAHFTFSPAGDLDFGVVERGAPVQPSIVLKNVGNISGEVASIQASGSLALQHSCTGREIGSGQTCPLQITLDTDKIGEQSGVLTATGSKNVATLSLRADIQGPVLDMSEGAAEDGEGGAGISASGANFGLVQVGTSKKKTVIATNTGTVPLTVGQVTISGGHDFNAQHGCVSIAPGESCVLQFTFTPSAVGSQTAAVVFKLGLSSNTYYLQGQGAAADISFAQDTAELGYIAPGLPASRSFTIRNAGALSGKVLGVTVQGAATLASTTCSAGGTLNPQESCTATVSLNTSTTGAKTATVFAHSQEGTASLPVDFTVQPSVIETTPAQSPITWNKQGVGVAVRKLVTLTNTGATAHLTGLAVSGGSKFSLVTSVGAGACDLSGETVLMHEQSCIVSLQYQPTAVSQEDLATLAYSINGQAQSLPLSGSAGAVSYSMTPSSATTEFFEPDNRALNYKPANELGPVYAIIQLNENVSETFDISLDAQGAQNGWRISDVIAGNGSRLGSSAGVYTIQSGLQEAQRYLRVEMRWSPYSSPSVLRSRGTYPVTLQAEATTVNPQSMSVDFAYVFDNTATYTVKAGNRDGAAPPAEINFGLIAVNQSIDGSKIEKAAEQLAVTNPKPGGERVGVIVSLEGSEAFSLQSYPSCPGIANPARSACLDIFGNTYFGVIVRAAPTTEGVHLGELLISPLVPNTGPTIRIPLKTEGRYEMQAELSQQPAIGFPWGAAGVDFGNNVTHIPSGGAAIVYKKKIYVATGATSLGKLKGTFSLAGSSDFKITEVRAAATEASATSANCSVLSGGLQTNPCFTAPDHASPGMFWDYRHFEVTVSFTPRFAGTTSNAVLTFTPDPATRLTPMSVGVKGSAYFDSQLSYSVGASFVWNANGYAPLAEGQTVDLGRAASGILVGVNNRQVITKYIAVRAQGRSALGFEAIIEGDSDVTMGGTIEMQWDAISSGNRCYPTNGRYANCHFGEDTEDFIPQNPVKWAVIPINFAPMTAPLGHKSAVLRILPGVGTGQPEVQIPLSAQSHNDLQVAMMSGGNPVPEIVDLGTVENSHMIGSNKVDASYAFDLVRANAASEQAFIAGTIEVQSPSGAFTLSRWGYDSTNCSIAGGTQGLACASTIPTGSLFSGVDFKPTTTGEHTATVTFTPHPSTGASPIVRTFKATSKFAPNIVVSSTPPNQGVTPVTAMDLTAEYYASNSSSQATRKFYIFDADGGTIGATFTSAGLQSIPGASLRVALVNKDGNTTTYDTCTLNVLCVTGSGNKAVFSVELTLRPTQSPVEELYNVTATFPAAAGVEPVSIAGVASVPARDKTPFFSSSKTQAQPVAQVQLPSRAANSAIDGSAPAAKTSAEVYIMASGEHGDLAGNLTLQGGDGDQEITSIRSYTIASNYETGASKPNASTIAYVGGVDGTGSSARGKEVLVVQVSSIGGTEGSFTGNLVYSPAQGQDWAPISIPIHSSVVHNTQVSKWSMDKEGSQTATSATLKAQIDATRTATAYLAAPAGSIGKLGGVVALTGPQNFSLAEVAVVSQATGAVIRACALDGPQTSALCVTNEPSTSGDQGAVIRVIVRQATFISESGSTMLSFTPVKGSAIGVSLEAEAVAGTKVVKDFGEFRAWEDGSVAASCFAYRQEAAQGAVSGVYRMTTQGATFDAYCDMASDGGGWTLFYAGAATNEASRLTLANMASGSSLKTFTTDAQTRPVPPSLSLNLAFSQVMVKGGATQWTNQAGGWVAFDSWTTAGVSSPLLGGSYSQSGRADFYHIQGLWGITPGLSESFGLAATNNPSQSICGGAYVAAPKVCPSFDPGQSGNGSHYDTTTYREVYIR